MIVLLVALLIILCAAVHRYIPHDRVARGALAVAAVGLMLFAVLGYVQAANAAVPCSKFIPANVQGPQPPGVCRLVPTRFHMSKLYPITGHGLSVDFGNRDTVRIADANSRGIKDIATAACGGVALRSPVAGAACYAAVVVYGYLLGSTFESAANSGRCTHVEFQGLIPIHWRPITC